MAKNKKPVTADLLGQVPNGNDVLMQPVPSTPMQTDLAQYDAGAMYRAAMAAEPPAAVGSMYGGVPSVRDNLLRTPAPMTPQDRHPGMPASVANFDGAQIVRDAAAAHQAQRPAQGLRQQAPSTPIEGAYVPSGIKPAGGARTGDPFLDVNTDFGALAADKAVKDANDAAFTQMNRGRMSGIAASREAANSDRNSRLQQMGMDPTQIERTMYPERFSDLRGEAMANVDGRAKPARMSQQAFDETNGRISATSRTDALMRKARLNGQNLPYAQAYGMAQNDLPQTGPDTVGQASLPGMNPARMAQFNPQAGAAAGMYMNGNQRNANDAAAEQGRQGLTRDQQANAHTAAGWQNDREKEKNATADKVATAALGNPNLQTQQFAATWLANPANAMHMGTPLWDAMMRNASGAGAAPASAAPGAAAPAVPGAAPQPATVPQAASAARDALLASNQQAMQAHLNTIQDPMERLREQARIYANNGQGNHPSVNQYLMGRFAQDDPNLAWGPDHWAQSYGGDQSIVNWLFGDKPIAGRAADFAAENYGIPADVALPHFQRHYGRM
jgi:hypothetical protein